jgi:5-methylthioadenosine/S-adenosylhomocysteine deaminase
MTRWLVRGGLVATCDDQHTTFEGDVAVEDGALVALGPGAADALTPPYRVLDARGCAVLPGFVQGHIHLVQTLFRGMAEGVPLLEWLRRYIWPLEAAHDEASLRASAELGLCELVRSGTTTLLDMGTTHGHDAVFEACLASGARVFGGKAMMDAGRGVPKGLRETTAESLRESARLADAWQGREGRIGYAYCPRFILSCSEKLLRAVAEAAPARGALVHTHAAEHASERAAVRAIYGASDVEVLARFGLKGPHVVLAHGVQLTPGEMTRAAKAGTRVVHCPNSNLKLGSGVASVRELGERGVHVGLGADGAPCNNNLDAFHEMRSAGLVAGIRSGPGSLDARAVLHLATLGGARALGLASKIGSLEPGKRADLVVVALDDVHAAPALDPLVAVVFACQSRDVRHVMADGRLLVRDGEPLDFDAPRIAARAREEARRVGLRAGVL